jgi:hypothetical protein
VSEPVYPADVIRLEQCPEADTCGIIALSRLLGQSYPDVLRATTLTDRNLGKQGLWPNTMIRVAAMFGCTLVRRKRVDLHEDYGILIVPEHVTLLRNGLVFEPDACVWDVYDYLASEKWTERDVEGILVVK